MPSRSKEWFNQAKRDLEQAGPLQSEEAIGYFGSYARGDWGVGSDLDIIVVIDESEDPFEKRASRWDTTDLPVPADLLVYTKSEFDSLDPASRFCQTLDKEVVWLYERNNVVF